MAPTYTVQISFDRAKNLPVADIRTLSCDPFVVANLIVPGVDEPLKFRTPTAHHTRDPTWNSTWLVSGVPASGFKLLMILYDEDPNAKLSVDRLGKAEAHFSAEDMRDGFESLEKEYTLQKRRGDLHPYLLTYFTALLPGQKLRKHNRVVVSVRVIKQDKDNDGRVYTLGPNTYSRHFSPLIGSMVNSRIRKDAFDMAVQTDGKGRVLSSTTFIANKLQLTGPVPRELRHRYVGYRPFIDWMFDDSGVAGRILYHGLHQQHRTVYKCDKTTVWGVIDDTGVDIDKPPPAPSSSSGNGKDGGVGRHHMLWEPTEESSAALARAFLDMTAWGEGGKLFTYVITLDGEWRFTETGPEFAIDLLSKHSMHANLAKEVAYSGEFFVQRVEEDGKLEHPQQQQNGDATILNGDAHDDATHTNGDAAAGAPNGNASAPNGDAAAGAPNGNASAPNGDAAAAHTNGDASADAHNGDAAAAQTNGDAVPLIPSSSPSPSPTTPTRDPKLYSLIIDNNSGTYRPRKSLLPLFESWLSDARRLGGLGRVRALDGFDEGLKGVKEARGREKEALRARAKKGGREAKGKAQ